MFFVMTTFLQAVKLIEAGYRRNLPDKIGKRDFIAGKYRGCLRCVLTITTSLYTLKELSIMRIFRCTILTLLSIRDFQERC